MKTQADKKQAHKSRKKLQSFTWLALPIVAIGGWFYPLMGWLLLGCMVGSVGVAFFKGRAWCDWMCPRGSFFDVIIARFSRKIEIPSFFRNKGIRIFMLGMIFTMMGVQFYFAWGNAQAMGLALVRILTVTTVVGIILGLSIHPRVWCHICPMGTVGNWVSTGKKPLYVSDDCVGCKLCARACPMQLKPYEGRNDGMFGNNDCIKCASCVATCPKKALSFGSEGDQSGNSCSPDKNKRVA